MVVLSWAKKWLNLIIIICIKDKETMNNCDIKIEKVKLYGSAPLFVK